MRKYKITLMSGHQFKVGVLDEDIELSVPAHNDYSLVADVQELHDPLHEMDCAPIDLLIKHKFTINY